MNYSSTCLKCQRCTQWVNSFRIPLLSQVSFLVTAATVPSWYQYHGYSDLPLMNCVFDILFTHLDCTSVTCIWGLLFWIWAKDSSRSERRMSMCGASRLSSGAVVDDLRCSPATMLMLSCLGGTLYLLWNIFLIKEHPEKLGKNWLQVKCF